MIPLVATVTIIPVWSASGMAVDPKRHRLSYYHPPLGYEPRRSGSFSHTVPRSRIQWEG